MKAFLLFCVAVGAVVLTAYMCLQHPADVRKGLSDGVGTAASAVSSGVQKGASAAQTAIATPPAPPKK
jgi:hypothetical protein